MPASSVESPSGINQGDAGQHLCAGTGLIQPAGLIRKLPPTTTNAFLVSYYPPFHISARRMNTDGSRSQSE